ncbi:MAG: DNA cytosine methyltransferase, partial [Candidatus Thermoplasmatota archaeon]|nr:DNA cytosine methyltransferase [Candidatus Thermoplasmatota archaeon]
EYITGTWDESSESVHLANVPNRIRRITPNEAFRIQGFKQDLIDKLITSGLSDTRLYMAAGNAVPPPLVKNVLDSLLFEKSQQINLQQNIPQFS